MILVIDESELLFGLLEPMLEGTGVRATRVKDVQGAKRKLIEVSPKLVLSFAKIGADPEAGYRFCKELQSHPTLSQTPVLLFAEELTDTVIRLATDSGAKGIALWPISAEALIRRVGMLLPEVGDQSSAAAATSAKAPSAGLQPAASGSRLPKVAAQQPKAAAAPTKTPPRAPAQPATEMDRKIMAAQQILARVLYDLKTSDLLQVVDLADVPRVVAEITRAACNLSPDDKEKRAGASMPFSISPEPAAAPELKKADEPVVSGMDLEKIFGIKK